MADKIIQQIELQGQQQVKQGFDQIGASADKASASINKMGGAEAGKGLKDIGQAARDAVGGISGLNDSMDQAGKTVGATSIELVKFGQILRLLGRAARIPELSTLGRSLGVIGRIAAIAAPVILIAGLGKLASAAADATTEVVDLAAASKTSVSEFQELASAQAAVGGSAKDAGDMMKSLNELVREGADRNAKNSETFKRLSDNIAESRERIEELARGYQKIAKVATDALEKIFEKQQKLRQESLKSIQDFDKSMRKLQQRKADLAAGGKVSPEEQRRREEQELAEEEKELIAKRDKESMDRLKELIKLQKEEQKVKEDRAEAERKLAREIELENKKMEENARQLRVAREEAIRNESALDKLGLRYTDNQGKLIRGKEVLFEIADALAATTDPAKRAELELALIAAGIDQKLIPALSRGAQGYKDLIKEGEKLKTPINDADIKKAHDFQIALGQLGTVLGDIGKQLGLAIAPGFTEWLKEMVILIQNNKEEIIEFAKDISSIFLPVFKALGDLIRESIIFMGNFERGLKRIKEEMASLTTEINKLLPAWAQLGKQKVPEVPKGKKVPEDFKMPTGVKLAAGQFKPVVEGLEHLINTYRKAGTAADDMKKKVEQPIKPPEIPQPKPWSFADLMNGATQFWEFIKAKWNEGLAYIDEQWKKIASPETWELIKQVVTQAITALWEFIKQKWNEGVQWLTDKWNEWVKVYDETIKAIPALWDELWKMLGEKFTGWIDWIKEQWNAWFKWLEEKFEAAKKWAKGLLPGGGGGKAEATKGAARGWHVRGPGTSTSDSVPAWVSVGEYINRTAAVRKYGVGLFHALNQLRLPKNFAHNFAAGGIVSFNRSMARRPLRMASGGLASATNSMRPLNLQIGPDSFEGLLAPENVAKKLVRVATTRQMSSAGRKPAYYGRGR